MNSTKGKRKKKRKSEQTIKVATNGGHLQQHSKINDTNIHTQQTKNGNQTENITNQPNFQQ